MSQVSYTKESNGDIAPLPDQIWFLPLLRVSFRLPRMGVQDPCSRTATQRKKQKREVLKDLRGAAVARSQSPRKWTGKGYRGFQSFRNRSEQNAGDPGHPTEGESSGMPASPSSARRAGSLPSHPSQTEGDDLHDDFRVANACDCCDYR